MALKLGFIGIVTRSMGESLAFYKGTPDAVDQAFGEMIAAGFRGHVRPWDAFWGQRYATLLDPDGNSVDLFAALEAA